MQRTFGVIWWKNRGSSEVLLLGVSGDGLLDKEQLFNPGRSGKSAREEENWGEYICCSLFFILANFLLFFCFCLW